MPLLFSCGSFRSMEVETCNPASITFPPEIKTVMIVNNSAQQPDDAGHRYIRNGADDSIKLIPADSAAYDFCLRLGELIALSPVFRDVRLCQDTLRRDSAFYDKRPFSPDEVLAFCEDYGVDALISLQNLVFFTEMHETRLHTYFFEAAIKVRLSGEVRVMWPGQKEAYAIPFSDSLRWDWPEDFYFDPYEEAFPEADVQSAMRYLSGVAGEKMHTSFVPYWSQDRRWYYLSVSSEWKRGSAHAAAGKWSEAAAVWEAVLAKASKWKPKARLLSNLALCNEMTGDFEKAAACAAEACRLFETHAGEDDAYTRLQKNYLEILAERAANDRTLSRQLRE